MGNNKGRRQSSKVICKPIKKRCNAKPNQRRIIFDFQVTNAPLPWCATNFRTNTRTIFQTEGRFSEVDASSSIWSETRPLSLTWFHWHVCAPLVLCPNSIQCTALVLKHERTKRVSNQIKPWLNNRIKRTWLCHTKQQGILLTIHHCLTRPVTERLKQLKQFLSSFTLKVLVNCGMYRTVRETKHYDVTRSENLDSLRKYCTPHRWREDTLRDNTFPKTQWRSNKGKTSWLYSHAFTKQKDPSLVRLPFSAARDLGGGTG